MYVKSFRFISAGNALLQKRTKRYRIYAFTRKSLNLH